MNTPDNTQIVTRFFQALQVLIDEKVIRGKKTFTDRHNINRRNFWQIEKKDRVGLFDVAWLSYLVEDYGVSAEWLLTGKGQIIQ